MEDISLPRKDWKFDFCGTLAIDQPQKAWNGVIKCMHREKLDIVMVVAFLKLTRRKQTRCPLKGPTPLIKISMW